MGRCEDGGSIQVPRNTDSEPGASYAKKLPTTLSDNINNANHRTNAISFSHTQLIPSNNNKEVGTRERNASVSWM